MKWLPYVISPMLLCAGSAGAQQSSAIAYPVKPIRLVVPLAAGGPSDHTARALAVYASRTCSRTPVQDSLPSWRPPP